MVNEAHKKCVLKINRFNALIPSVYRKVFSFATFLFRHQAYCDITVDRKGWTLIARFSNNDNKNWMLDDGSWWYD